MKTTKALCEKFGVVSVKENCSVCSYNNPTRKKLLNCKFVVEELKN